MTLFVCWRIQGSNYFVGIHAVGSLSVDRNFRSRTGIRLICKYVERLRMNKVFRIVILCAFAFSGCLSGKNSEVMIDTNKKTKKGVSEDYQPTTPASEMLGPQ
jgi:hypothetical protein